MNIGNPLLQNKTFSLSTNEPVSINSLTNKMGLSFLFLLVTFMFTWDYAKEVIHTEQSTSFLTMLTLGSVVAGFILAMIIIFAKCANVFTVLSYSAIEGVVLGSISLNLEIQYPGIVFQAILGTLGAFASVFALYKFKVIRYSPMFARVLIMSMVGIMIMYLVGFIGSLMGFQMSFLYSSSPLSIGISVVVVIIASLNLVIDFHNIEQSIGRADKRYEWYLVFGLLVTLIWMYIEILRLLSKIRR